MRCHTVRGKYDLNSAHASETHRVHTCITPIPASPMEEAGHEALMALNLTNSTSEPTPHDTDYDAAAATWIAIIGILFIGGLFALPWALDPSWYEGYATPYGTHYAVAQQPPRRMVQPSAQDIPVAIPVLPAPLPSATVAVQLAASPKGVVVACRPNLSGIKA